MTSMNDGCCRDSMSLCLVRKPAGAASDYAHRAPVPATPGNRLYGASHTAPLQRCAPAGRRTNPVAAMILMEAKLMTNKRPRPGHETGIIGLGVIGCNLLLDMADPGFPVAAGDPNPYR